MRVGYARTSTVDQVAGLEAQLEELKRAGCGEDSIYSEQISSIGRRPQFDACIKFVRKGDTLTVTKLDRLARSVADLMKIVETLRAKGVELHILNLGIDTATPTGKLILTMLGGIAEFERAIMLERQREGIAKAQRAGKYKGRKPTARAKAAEVKELLASGVKAADVARKLGIGKRSVYRVRKDAA